MCSPGPSAKPETFCHIERQRTRRPAGTARIGDMKQRQQRRRPFVSPWQLVSVCFAQIVSPTSSIAQVCQPATKLTRNAHRDPAALIQMLESSIADAAHLFRSGKRRLCRHVNAAKAGVACCRAPANPHRRHDRTASMRSLLNVASQRHRTPEYWQFVSWIISVPATQEGDTFLIR